MATSLRGYLLWIRGNIVYMAEGVQGTFLENLNNTERSSKKISIGKVPEYDSEDQWPTYKLRLNSQLVVNEVTDAFKRIIFFWLPLAMEFWICL